MKNVFIAVRPKTLLASFIPPAVSFGYYISQGQESPYLLLVCCIMSAVFIQIATNLFNDVIDFKKGADTIRKGPTRVTAAGLVRPETTLKWASLSLLAAIIFSIPIIMKGGIIFLFLGVISLYLSYGYTGGPLPLAYKGLGELFVFLFFGLFSVMGSYYLYSNQLDFESFVLSLIYGCLTTTFICVNNLRDREEDKKVGKLTLATKTGAVSYKLLTLSTIFLPYLLLHFLKSYQNITYTFLALIPAMKLSAIVLYKKDEQLNQGLKYAGIHLVIFSILFLFTIHK